MEVWSEGKISDFADVKGGKRLPKGKQLISEPNLHPYIRIRDLGKSKVLELNSDYEYVDDETQKSIARYIVDAGDILISVVGTIGLIAIVGESLDKANQTENCDKIINLKGINRDYLYYYLISPAGQEEIKKGTVGAVQPKLPLKNVQDINIKYPSLETQEKIVSILNAIDAKIYTNEAINRNLQEQLKAIFDAWFYKMEPFGGEEPKGTEYIPLEKLCVAVTKGTTPTTLGMSFTDEGINFIKGETILDNHGFDRSKLSFISEDTHEKLKRSQIENGDIVFTIAGTLGRFALVDESMIPANTNQAVAIIRSKCIAPEYLYSFFLGNWHNDYYTKRIQQAVQANLSLGTIKSLPIAVLPKVYYKEYLDIIKPLIRETKRIEAENMKLIELRDSLLPRLMSGELDVSDLDI